MWHRDCPAVAGSRRCQTEEPTMTTHAVTRQAPSARHLRAVLLDIDGTLLDSNDAHTRAWLDVLGHHGHRVDYETVRRMIGKGGDKVVCELLGLAPDSAAARQISDERKADFLARLPALQPTRGARDLLQHLKAIGLRLLVATSAGGPELDALLRQAGVDDLVDIATTSSDAEHSKPDPDIIEVALRKGGLEAHAAVMVGDTPYDIEAAAAAGVATIALRCGGWWDDAALGGAVAIYDDPADLLRQFEGSPLAATAFSEPSPS
jgi:HAD superfamily hydrolase (TIGR01509 family)